MSASRTLLRLNKADRDRRDESKRIKPGTENRRVVWSRDDGTFARSYHATKGLRQVRS